MTLDIGEVVKSSVRAMGMPNFEVTLECQNSIGCIESEMLLI